MEYSQFEAQMRRLAASYRVEIHAPTIAAYWTVFANTDDGRFVLACERAIEHEKTFPTPAVLKEIIRQHHETTQRAASALASSASVGCLTCMDAGIISRDVPVQHADFGKLTPCPHCDGAKKPRNYKAEYAAFLERDHAEIARLRPYREQQAAARALTHPAQEAYSEAREMAEVSP